MNYDILMDDNNWVRLLRNVAQHFDEVTISRGFQYYKQGRVAELRYPGPERLEALVRDNESCHVSIYLRMPGLPGCDCPVVGPCKHMMAVLFAYVEAQGRSVHLLANAAGALHSRFGEDPDGEGGWPEARAAAARQRERERLAEQAQRLETADTDAWHEWFGLCVSGIEPFGRAADFAARLATAIENNAPVMQDHGKAWLFGINADLYVLARLVRHTGASQGYNSYAFNYSDGYTLNELESALLERTAQVPSGLNGNPAVALLLDQTRARFRAELLADTSKQRYFLNGYMLLWDRRLPSMSDETLNAELRLLEAEGPPETATTRLGWLLAQAWLRLLLADDDAALHLLEAAGKLSPIGLNPSIFFARLTADNAWTRLRDWLVRLTGAIANRGEILRQYFEHWHRVVEKLPEAEPQMWNAYVELLPLSGVHYEEKLLSFGRYRQWMDYQLSIGADPSAFRVTDLQPLERNAPELLLPFYHQAVERHVLAKNRDGYKAAVKLLKRLAKLYRKLKQEARWEQFLDGFAVRHSRLRALREELRKGNLLS